MTATPDISVLAALFPGVQFPAGQPAREQALESAKSREPKRRASASSNTRKSSKTGGDDTPHSHPDGADFDSDELDEYHPNGSHGAGTTKKKSSSRRPPLDPKRREQNRAAQRAWRERKEKHLRDLEERVKHLEAVENENVQLKGLVDRLSQENETLKTFAFSFVAPDGAPSKVPAIPVSLPTPSGTLSLTASEPKSPSLPPSVNPMVKRYPSVSEPSDPGYASKDSPSSPSSHDGNAAAAANVQGHGLPWGLAAPVEAAPAPRERVPSVTPDLGKLESTFLPLSIMDPVSTSISNIMKLEPRDDDAGAVPTGTQAPSTVLSKGFLQFRDRAGMLVEEDDDEYGAFLPLSRQGSSMRSVTNAGPPPGPSPLATVPITGPDNGAPKVEDFDVDFSDFVNPSDWPMPNAWDDWSQFPPEARKVLGEILPQAPVDSEGAVGEWTSPAVAATKQDAPSDILATTPLSVGPVRQTSPGFPSTGTPVPAIAPPAAAVDVTSLPRPLVFDLLRKLDPESIQLSPEGLQSLRSVDIRQIPCPLTARRMAELKRVFGRGVEVTGECGMVKYVGQGKGVGIAPEDFDQLCKMMTNTSCEERGKRVLAAAQKLVEARATRNGPNPPKDAWAKVLTARKELKELIDTAPEQDREMMVQVMTKFDVYSEILGVDYDPQHVSTVMSFLDKENKA